MVWLSCCKFVHCYFLYHLVLNCKQKEIPRKRIRKPTVSFIDVNREFATSQSRSSESASGIGSDHDDNSTSDADDEDITTEDDLIQPILDGLRVVTLDLDTDSDININSEFLSQYLTESGPPTQNSQTAVTALAGDENPSTEDANWDSN